MKRTLLQIEDVKKSLLCLYSNIFNPSFGQFISLLFISITSQHKLFQLSSNILDIDLNRKLYLPIKHLLVRSFCKCRKQIDLFLENAFQCCFTYKTTLYNNLDDYLADSFFILLCCTAYVKSSYDINTKTMYIIYWNKRKLSDIIISN